MSRRWSAALEVLGSLRLPRLIPASWFRRRLEVGDPKASDARGSDAWRAYLAPVTLFDTWGPHAGGPWVPYHCVPLFAALDRLRPEAVGPAPAPGSPARPTTHPELPAGARPGARAPGWLTPSTWTILDLAGPRSVEAAAWLITTRGCQPVCTFDNWPHEKGVLRPEHTLAELLRWASTVAEVRQRLDPDSPPLWICDRERLGDRRGRPSEFDNRYYMDDSILPGPGVLARHGIERVVYVVPNEDDDALADLESYFADLVRAGITVLRLAVATEGATPQPFASGRRPRQPPRTGFRRSSAGGFGTLVPEPSSGSSG